MKRIAVGAICALVVLCTSAFGYYTWKWDKENDADSVYDPTKTYPLWLTKNNGSRAVALVGNRTIVTGFYGEDDNSPDYVNAYEWSVAQRQSPFPNNIWASDVQFPLPGFPCVAANEAWKFFMCSDGEGTGTYKYACLGKTGAIDDMNVANYDEINFTKQDYQNKEHTLAALCFPTGSRMVAAYDAYDGTDWWLASRVTSDAGDDDWGGPNGTIPIAAGRRMEPSLGVSAGCSVYVAYRNAATSTGNILFEKSTNYGGRWDYTDPPATLGTGERPCVAAAGQFVFVIWHSSGKIAYKFSRDGGANWTGPDTVSRLGNGCSHTSVSLVTFGTSDTAILLASQWSKDDTRFVFYRYGILVRGQPPRIAWQASAAMPGTGTEDNLRPSLATAGSYGRLVYNTPIGNHKRGFHLRRGNAFDDNGSYRRDWAVVGTGRLIARHTDGAVQHAATVRPHVVSGPVEPDLIPILVAPGNRPALALDAAGNRWVSYTHADTVWVRTGSGCYKAVFCGSSSATPGQPSIVCYPNQANGVYVGSVVFPVYDTSGAASKIMYARVDTGGVVLDTIESVANLGDSLPCVSVYQSDTLVVTWQHGDSTLASMLCDYGPGTSGQVPAWSSPNLVAANGYHAMSRFDDNGTVLNVVWTRKNGSNYAIQRATCDLSTSLFGNWSQMVYFGDTILNFLDLESARP